MKNLGKVFEADVKESLKEQGLFVLRLKDDANNFTKRTDNLCDFIMYDAHKLYLLELKSYKGKSIPLPKLTQLEGLMSYSSFKGIVPCFVMNYRDLEETYFITAEKVSKIEGRKSVSIDYCRAHGLLIEHQKKRVHYRYNFIRLLEVINNESYT